MRASLLYRYNHPQPSGNAASNDRYPADPPHSPHLMTDFCAFPACLSDALADIRCAVCGQAYYCSSEHQLRDFTRHRDECRSIPPPSSSSSPCSSPSSSSSSTLGNRKMLSVLLFPVDEDSPRIIQTECRVEDDDDDPNKKAHQIDFGALLQAPSGARSFHLPVGHIQRSEPPTRLYLAGLEGTTTNGAPRNRAVAQLMGGVNDYPLPLGGTLIGYRAREPTRDWTQYMDVSPDDIPAYSAFLRAREYPDFVITWRYMKWPSSTSNILRAMFKETTRAGSMSSADPPTCTQQSYRSVQVQTESLDNHDVSASLINRVHIRPLQVDFEQQNAAIRAIVAEESLRTTLTALAVAAGVCAAGACVVFPIFAFCAMLSSAVDATVGALLSAFVRGGQFVWSAVSLLSLYMARLS
ncbi:hypothetical protein C8Q73DRAFT_680930 [Cubamyces lactineus]|nr:hypothetical protein C8Q73DRAFT_680930 [Cubamyces lactineus]